MKAGFSMGTHEHWVKDCLEKHKAEYDRFGVEAEEGSTALEQKVKDENKICRQNALTCLLTDRHRQ